MRASLSTASTSPKAIAALITLAAAAAAPIAGAAIITDSSYFTSIPSTLITFEADGAGNVISLIDGQRQVMPTNAYSALGVTFNGIGSPVYWVNDGNAAFDAAQALEASPDNSIPSSLTSQFTVTFATPVHAFGFFVANNRLVDAAGPSFVARDISGAIIEIAQFGAPFIDGSITIPNTIADYGFMGLSSATPIASIAITKQAAILDDFRYTTVPAPGALALAAAGGLLIIRRRR